MRILWIVNTIFPYPAKQLGINKCVFGGWLNGLFNALNKERNVNIAIATVYEGKDFKKFVDKNVYYYLIPYKNKGKYISSSKKYWEIINKDFNPDLVHLHGSEYPFGLVYVNNFDVPTLLSIQGLVSVYSDYYNAGIRTNDILKNITIRDLLRMDTIFHGKQKFKKNGLFEKKLINKVNYITGRTTWDYANTYSVVLKDKYFKCNESLRDAFYNNNWSINNVKRHTIFISQASYPIKGFHVLIKALALLKNKYPDVMVYVAGQNILKNVTLKDKFKLTGYAKYLTKLIKKNKLEDNIMFTGLLDEDQMCKKMLESHVYVQASAIENSSNSLGEAMIIGMPSVASCVGGTSDMMYDKEEGFLYPFGDYAVLAQYITNIFEDDKLAADLGIKARKHAMLTHDRKENASQMLKIYKEIINESNK